MRLDDSPLVFPLPDAEFADVDEPDPLLEGLVVVVGAIGVDKEPPDADDVPDPLMAAAENVYWVPFVKPGIVHEVAGGVTRHVRPPGWAVTV